MSRCSSRATASPRIEAAEPLAGRIATAFERAPVLAERLEGLAAAPVDRIIAEARRIVGRLDEEARIAILDAHPRIGAAASTLSDRSRAEQGAAGDAQTLRDLAMLNEAYRVQFAPAEARGDIVAVSMVWLVSNTTVKGRPDTGLTQLRQALRLRNAPQPLAPLPVPTVKPIVPEAFEAPVPIAVLAAAAGL